MVYSTVSTVFRIARFNCVKRNVNVQENLNGQSVLTEPVIFRRFDVCPLFLPLIIVGLVHFRYTNSPYFLRFLSLILIAKPCSLPCSHTKAIRTSTGTYRVVPRARDASRTVFENEKRASRRIRRVWTCSRLPNIKRTVAVGKKFWRTPGESVNIVQHVIYSAILKCFFLCSEYDQHFFRLTEFGVPPGLFQVTPSNNNNSTPNTSPI
jgi:hypothetical protein